MRITYTNVSPSEAAFGSGEIGGFSSIWISGNKEKTPLSMQHTVLLKSTVMQGATFIVFALSSAVSWRAME